MKVSIIISIGFSIFAMISTFVPSATAEKVSSRHALDDQEMNVRILNKKKRRRKKKLLSDKTPPELHSSGPVAGTIINTNTVELFAKITDPSGLRTVRFMTRSPTGQISTWLSSSLRQGTVDLYDSEPIDLTVPGKWSYRVRAVDLTPNSNVLTSPWIDFFHAGDVPSTIELVRSEIANLIISTPTPNLAPKFVRLGFHDCIPGDDLKGGCDGCVDLSNPDNNGLHIPINALKPIVDKYTTPAYGLSRADIWALAALVGAEISQSSIAFPMEFVGRIDCENAQDVCYKEDGSVQPCQENRGPHRPLPSADMTTSELLHWFSSHFQFSAKETTAIMGAHTIGTARPENSGFQGENGWVNNNKRLTNGYYNMIVAPTPGREDAISDFEAAMFAPAWDIELVDNSNIGRANKYQWTHQKDPNREDAENINLEKIIMLNADIALVRDLEGHLEEDGNVQTCQFRCLNNICRPGTPPRCPHAQQTFEFAREYESDNLLWLNDFSAVFRKMLIQGYDHDSTTCSAGSPCTLTPKQ